MYSKVHLHQPSIVRYSGNFRGVQFSRFSQICGYPRKLDLRNKYNCTVYNGQDCMHPRKLNRESFEDWPSAKIGPHENFPHAVYGNLSSTIVYQDCSLQSKVALPEEQTGISADADIPSLNPVTSTATPTLREVMWRVLVVPSGGCGWVVASRVAVERGEKSNARYHLVDRTRTGEIELNSEMKWIWVIGNNYYSAYMHHTYNQDSCYNIPTVAKKKMVTVTNLLSNRQHPTPLQQILC
jgi:hypothetical protein